MCPTEAGRPAAAPTQPSLDPEAPTGSPFHQEHLRPPHTRAQRPAPGTDPRPLPQPAPPTAGPPGTPDSRPRPPALTAPRPDGPLCPSTCPAPWAWTPWPSAACRRPSGRSSCWAGPCSAGTVGRPCPVPHLTLGPQGNAGSIAQRDTRRHRPALVPLGLGRPYSRGDPHDRHQFWLRERMPCEALGAVRPGSTGVGPGTPGLALCTPLGDRPTWQERLQGRESPRQ